MAQSFASSVLNSPGSMDNSDSMDISGPDSHSHRTNPRRKAAMKFKARSSPAVTGKNEALANILGVSTTTQDFEYYSTTSATPPLEPDVYMSLLSTLTGQHEDCTLELSKSIKAIIIDLYHLIVMAAM